MALHQHKGGKTGHRKGKKPKGPGPRKNKKKRKGA